MNRKALFTVAALLLTVAASSLIARIQAPSKRAVFMTIEFVSAKRTSKLAALEGDSATMAIADVGQFTFTPSFKKGDDKTVVVTVSDATSQPGRELGKVDVPVGGKGVDSKTKPAFIIQVTGVTQSK